jgi:hypothetical protein
MNSEFKAPRSLYCGVCVIRIAHENHDENFVVPRGEAVSPVPEILGSRLKWKKSKP